MSQHTSSGGDLLLRLYLPPIPLLLGDAYHSRGNLKVFPNFQSTSKDRCVCTAARWQTAALLHYCDKAFVCICQLPTLRGPQNVLRMAAMRQAAYRPQKTDARTFQPHTPTGCRTRRPYCFAKLLFQILVVEGVEPINE